MFDDFDLFDGVVAVLVQTYDPEADTFSIGNAYLALQRATPSDRSGGESDGLLQTTRTRFHFRATDLPAPRPNDKIVSGLDEWSVESVAIETLTARYAVDCVRTT